MTKCECGKETLSIMDIVSNDGTIDMSFCCPKCYRKHAKGARLSRNGDLVKGQTLMRWHNREYKPMSHINWLFWLASK